MIDLHAPTTNDTINRLLKLVSEKTKRTWSVSERNAWRRLGWFTFDYFKLYSLHVRENNHESCTWRTVIFYRDSIATRGNHIECPAEIIIAYLYGTLYDNWPIKIED